MNNLGGDLAKIVLGPPVQSLATGSTTGTTPSDNPVSQTGATSTPDTETSQATPSAETQGVPPAVGASQPLAPAPQRPLGRDSRGGLPSSPAPRGRGGLPSGPAPNRGGLPSSPAPNRGGLPSSPAPRGRGLPSGPASSRGGLPPGPGPARGGLPSSPAPPRGGLPSSPAPRGRDGLPSGPASSWGGLPQSPAPRGRSGLPSGPAPGRGGLPQSPAPRGRGGLPPGPASSRGGFPSQPSTTPGSIQTRPPPNRPGFQISRFTVDDQPTHDIIAPLFVSIRKLAGEVAASLQSANAAEKQLFTKSFWPRGAFQDLITKVNVTEKNCYDAVLETYTNLSTLANVVVSPPGAPAPNAPQGISIRIHRENATQDEIDDGAKGGYNPQTDSIELFEPFWRAADLPVEGNPPSTFNDVAIGGIHATKAIILLHELVHVMSIKAPGLRPLVSAAEVHTREDAPHRVVDVAMGDYFMGSQAENVALGAVRLDGAAPNLTPEQLLNAKLHVKAYGVVGTRALAQYDLAPLATGLNADSYAIYAAGVWFALHGGHGTGA